MKTGVSVIIPVFNGEHEIRSCLEALQGQTYRGTHEVIVVDDGSTDRTASVVRTFRRVRLLRQKNRGPAAARNAGVRIAKGEILLFTDADCVPTPFWMEEMIKGFQDPAIQGVQGAYLTRQRSLVARFVQQEIAERYARMRRFPSVDFVGTYSAGYRRSIFKAFKGFDESFPHPSGEDSEFSFRVARSGARLAFLPRAQVAHAHPERLGDYLRVKFWRAYWRVPLYRKHAQKMVRESYTPQGLKLQIILLGLAFAGVVGSLVWEPLLFAAAGTYVLFAASTVPFAARAARADPAVGIASLVLLQLRAFVFLLGLTEGAIRTRGGLSGGRP